MVVVGGVMRVCGWGWERGMCLHARLHVDSRGIRVTIGDASSAGLIVNAVLCHIFKAMRPVAELVFPKQVGVLVWQVCLEQQIFV